MLLAIQRLTLPTEPKAYGSQYGSQAFNLQSIYLGYKLPNDYFLRRFCFFLSSSFKINP